MRAVGCQFADLKSDRLDTITKSIDYDQMTQTQVTVLESRSGATYFSVSVDTLIEFFLIVFLWFG